MNSTQTFGQMPYLLIPQSEPEATRTTMKIRINPLTQRPSTSNSLQQLQQDSQNDKALRAAICSTAGTVNTNNNNKVTTSLANSIVSNFLSSQLQQAQNASQDSLLIPSSATASPSGTATPTGQTTPRQPQRRRVRRKANSPADEQAEHLTEMSVRGLDLFRYAKIFEGIYQCTECAKENIQKTFKNKYSFQRHAFLYHEGTQRKVFPCPVCSKEFSRPDKMKNHMKTTHECYMPKDPVYPLSFLAGGGGDMPAGSPSAASPNSLKQSKEHEQPNNVTDSPQPFDSPTPKVDELLSRLQQSSSHLKIENVMSQYTAQIQAAQAHIKVENAASD